MTATVPFNPDYVPPRRTACAACGKPLERESYFCGDVCGEKWAKAECAAAAKRKATKDDGGLFGGAP